MKKYLFFLFAFVILLVGSFGVYSFADDPIDVRERDRIELESDLDFPIISNRSTISVVSGSVYSFIPFDVLPSQGYVNVPDYVIGNITNQGFVASSDTVFSRFQYYSPSSQPDTFYVYAYTSGSEHVTLFSQRNGVISTTYSGLKFLSSGSVDSSASFLHLFSTPLSNWLFDSITSFWSGLLNFGSTVIDFISDNWIAIIPLVLWVLIALFGVFRKLFKGV